MSEVLFIVAAVVAGAEAVLRRSLVAASIAFLSLAFVVRG